MPLQPEQQKRARYAGFLGRARRMYHFSLALFGALWYRFPSRSITVIAVTGTKGKTTTTELISAIFEEAGFKTALSNTVRFKIADTSERNLFKMSTPGRFFLQRFLRRAVSLGCTHAVIEMTSEGAALFRHRFIDLDALVVTNITPEHIESHGSYENYVRAKLSIAHRLAHSHKKNHLLVVNADDEETPRFKALGLSETVSYSLKEAAPFTLREDSMDITLKGTFFTVMLSGVFNIRNMLAAATCVEYFGVSWDVIIRAFKKFSGVPGRVERIDAGQNFTVVVDYAHTIDSLRSVYEVFKNRRMICVLGATGGGRDTWKRAGMGEIADAYCERIFLTDDDSYDEDPRAITEAMAAGITKHPYSIIVDRRAAIAAAIAQAQPNDVVIITGKGTDPFLMGPHGSAVPWSDAAVAREELRKTNLESGILRRCSRSPDPLASGWNLE